jgi:hypothetical protein
MMEYLFKSVLSEDEVHISTSMKVFNTLFAYAHDAMKAYKTELYQIFSKTLTAGSLEVRVNTIEAM